MRTRKTGRVGRQTLYFPLEPSPAGFGHHGVWDGRAFNDRAVVSPEQTLVLASCDPAAGLLGAELERTSPFRLIVLPRSSRQALLLLCNGPPWSACPWASASATSSRVRAIRVSFAEVDGRLEQAARTLGAGPIETFRRISLPLARRGVIAGAILAFARILGEFGATVMIAANLPGETQTIPLLIYSQINSPGGMEDSARLVVVSILVAAAALILAERLERGRFFGAGPSPAPVKHGNG
ncbi:MAG: ABC transporter permease subunit [Gemmataceae bacterium]|nr:ABC transporter permease subunit [Gemmataceae bacterium]